MEIFKSIIIFVLAGVCEIGGGYLIWLYLREDKAFWYGLAGAVIMVLYGEIATFQTSKFGRVYATYGGFFVVMSLLWAYRFDNYSPDKYDIVGAVIVLIGVCIIYYAPRS